MPVLTSLLGFLLRGSHQGEGGRCEVSNVSGHEVAGKVY